MARKQQKPKPVSVLPEQEPATEPAATPAADVPEAQAEPPVAASQPPVPDASDASSPVESDPEVEEAPVPAPKFRYFQAKGVRNKLFAGIEFEFTGTFAGQSVGVWATADSAEADRLAQCKGVEEISETTYGAKKNLKPEQLHSWKASTVADLLTAQRQPLGVSLSIKDVPPAATNFPTPLKVADIIEETAPPPDEDEPPITV